MAIRQITDIVKALVAQLDFTINIKGNTDNGGGNHILLMDNTYYLTKLKGIVIDGNKYVVTDFVFNESITVEPVGHTTPITVDTFELLAPLFFHGTIKTTEREVISTMEREPDAYPIVYLLEPIREKIFHDDLTQLERKSTVTIFLLDIYNPEDSDLNEDLLVNILKPMSNLEEELFLEIDKDTNIDDLSDDYNRTNMARFAIMSSTGEEKKIFNENLGGIRLELILPIRRKTCN